MAKLNILFLSLDQSLLGANKSGDTIERFQSYSKHLNTILALVPTTKKPVAISSPFPIEIYPAYGKDKLAAYFSLLLQTRKLLQTRNIDIVTANDPVLSLIGSLAKLSTGSQVVVEVNVLGNRLANISWAFERWYHPILWLVHLIAILTADHIRTDNTGDAVFLKNTFGFSKEKISVIPMVPKQVKNLKKTSLATT